MCSTLHSEVAAQLSVRDNIARDLDIKLTRPRNYDRVRPDAHALLRLQHNRSMVYRCNVFTFLRMRRGHLYRKEERAERKRAE